MGKYDCSSCRTSIDTPAEAAAHVCPTGPTDEEFQIAEERSKTSLQQRQALRPTKEILLRDCISVAQQLNDCWDGEVEVVVALVPKGSMDIAYTTNITSPVKLYKVLTRMTDDSTKIVNVKEKVKS